MNPRLNKSLTPVSAGHFWVDGQWELEALHGARALLPVVVLLAVDAAVLAEAGELRLQVEFTLAALEAAHVPLLVHSQQVVPVRDLPAAARAQSHALAAHARHGLHEDTASGDMEKNKVELLSVCDTLRGQQQGMLTRHSKSENI